MPPAHVAGALADAMRRGLARGYLDVASVKGGPRRELEALGLDLTGYIGTHPMAGRERSGPLAATGDLFEGRPWVLTPTRDTDTEVLNLALELVALCRAVPVVMDADAHDRAVALVSHTPQLVSSMVAARLEHAEETRGTAVRPGHPRCDPDRRRPTPGCGSTSSPRTPARSPTSSPTSPPTWTRRSRRCGPCSASDDVEAARAAPAAVEDVLRRGNAGRVRVPGKHGAAPRRTRSWPSSSATSRASWPGSSPTRAPAGVNIEDVRIEHATGQQAGLVQLMVEPTRGPRARGRAARARLVAAAVAGGPSACRRTAARGLPQPPGEAPQPGGGAVAAGPGAPDRPVI